MNLEGRKAGNSFRAGDVAFHMGALRPAQCLAFNLKVPRTPAVAASR